MNPDEQIEAALKNGLFEDKSRINSNPVYRGLGPSIKSRYAAIMAV
jgi:hypothetical protein